MMPDNEKPIIFSASMIKAILNGSKTQTRRVVNPQPFLETGGDGLRYWLFRSPTHPEQSAWKDGDEPYWTSCPYGRVGGRLWIRETFYAYGKYRLTGNLTKTGKREVEFWDCTTGANGAYRYAADETLPKPADRFEFGWHKRPAIFMPRVASRISRDIAGVKVERVTDISEEDAQAEGVTPLNEFDTYRGAFQSGWDKLNGHRGFTWQSCPFVWAITFKRIHAD
jgi:hypothetical protein